MQRSHNKNMTIADDTIYQFPTPIKCPQNEADRPVIIGFGPAGMFAALKLAQAGLRPIIYERGESVQDRQHSVHQYWEHGILNTESNVQFGEGGAGTFSDGKLNTLIKDPTGRIREVLRVFTEFGADSSILYLNKPHIGTDVLATVVQNLRNHILHLGAEIHFQTRLDAIRIENHQITGIELTSTKDGSNIRRNCNSLCLAIGHSARDTFQMLHEMNCPMEPKAFAVGLRLEHPQDYVNYTAYGETQYALPTADYKVTYQANSGRGVYSFCMCPGGYVVNASSEPERIAVNGMSYSKRDGKNANSAIIVTVTPQDFGNGILDGISFQRNLEHLAYVHGNGNIPVQLLADFKQHRVSNGFGRVVPSIKGSYTFADLNKVLPAYITEAISEGVTGFARNMKRFDMDDAVFSGVESRTSSPVRIVRDSKSLESTIHGLFPCGEGAGYAGGITSAAVDGIKIAERIAERFA
jgi:uncharacterized FAD-dependent dehydrogenase